jgi:hypothetical protein
MTSLATNLSAAPKPAHTAIAVVRFLAATVLIVAAAMKVLDPTVPIWLRPLGIYGFAILMIGVAAEATIGALLLSGAFPRITHRLAATLFGMLALVAVYLFASGVKSCGCFGSITIGPLLMTVIDSAFAAFFLLVESHNTTRASRTPAFVAIGLGVIMAVIGTGHGILKAGGLPANQSSIVIDSNIIDLGLITEAQARHIERTFRVHNPTSQPIHIEKLDRTCTCASAVASANVIPPDGSIDITVVVDWTGRRGPQRADVSIVTREAFAANSLTIQGNVDAGVVAAPAEINLGSIPPGQTLRRQVRVIRTSAPSASDKSVTVISVTPSSPALTVTSLSAESAPPGSGAWFEIEIRTSDLPVNESQARVTFQIDGGHSSPIELMLNYQRLACNEPLTKAVRFRPGESVPQVVRFRQHCNQSSSEFRLSEEGQTRFAIESITPIEMGGVSFIDVRISAVNAEESNSPARLLCLVNGEEVSSVALIRF